MRIFNLILTALVMGLGHVHATDSSPELTPQALPPGPLLRRIGDFSSWQISFFYAQDKAKAPEGSQYPPRPDTFLLPTAPRTLTITRTNPRWLVVIKDVRGNRLEQCFDGEHEFVTGNSFPGAVPVARGRYSEYSADARNLTNYSQVDFPEMEWISKETYKGVLSNEQGAWLVFEHHGMVAYIDRETRFPVLWKKEGESRKFEQLARPSKMVELSKDAESLAHVYKKDAQRLKHPDAPLMLSPGG